MLKKISIKKNYRELPLKHSLYYNEIWRSTCVITQKKTSCVSAYRQQLLQFLDNYLKWYSSGVDVPWKQNKDTDSLVLSLLVLIYGSDYLFLLATFYLGLL